MWPWSNYEFEKKMMMIVVCYTDGSGHEGEIGNESQSESDHVDTKSESGEDGDNHHDGHSIVDLTIENILLLKFSSQHVAYNFSHFYAKYHGFGIRKDEVCYNW